MSYLIPGELIPEDGFIELNKGRETTTLKVANTSDRPIQIGSHYHFFESNKALEFDRKKSLGKRLDIPAVYPLPCFGIGKAPRKIFPHKQSISLHYFQACS